MDPGDNERKRIKIIFFVVCGGGKQPGENTHIPHQPVVTHLSPMKHRVKQISQVDCSCDLRDTVVWAPRLSYVPCSLLRNSMSQCHRMSFLRNNPVDVLFGWLNTNSGVAAAVVVATGCSDHDNSFTGSRKQYYGYPMMTVATDSKWGLKIRDQHFPLR